MAGRWDAACGAGWRGRPWARARRRDGTYLPGLGSGSAGRRAAEALPPSFLLPPPPPRSATHNTRRKRKSRGEARVCGSRESAGGRARAQRCLRWKEAGGRRSAVGASGGALGREATGRGRWPRRGRPGEPRKPPESGPRMRVAERRSPLPAGRGRRARARLSGPAAGARLGSVPLVPGGAASCRGWGAWRTLSYPYLLQASPGRRWPVEAAATLRGGPAGLCGHVTSDYLRASLLPFQE